jgi:hypothetical protein
LIRRPPRNAFQPEQPTKPSASNPFGHASATVPKSRRDPSELVSEREPHESHTRPAIGRENRLIPREDVEEEDDEAAATPRPVDGGIALEAVPKLVAPAEKLTSLPLDHRAGFVIACIDGETTVQTLIDVCGLPPIDVVRTLERLVELGVLVVR